MPAVSINPVFLPAPAYLESLLGAHESLLPTLTFGLALYTASTPPPPLAHADVR